jgi:hypothetical protein
MASSIGAVFDIFRGRYSNDYITSLLFLPLTLYLTTEQPLTVLYNMLYYNLYTYDIYNTSTRDTLHTIY